MIGEGLIRAGAMTRKQVEDILRRQKAGDRRMFGEYDSRQQEAQGAVL
jgi:hypothetical protein